MLEDQCRYFVLFRTMHGRFSLESLEQVDEAEHRSHARSKAQGVLAAMVSIHRSSCTCIANRSTSTNGTSTWM